LIETGWQNISKENFSIMMKRLVEQGGFKRSDAVSGFEAAGLYPLCREKNQ